MILLMKKLGRIVAIGCCYTSLALAWPVPERVVTGNHVYALLRYQLTPSESQSYGAPSNNWWGTLRELTANAPAQCDGFLNNDATCAPYVRNIIGAPIPNAGVSAENAVSHLLSLKNAIK